QLSAHWQRTVEFLDVVITAWPDHKSANTIADPGQHRRLVTDLTTKSLTEQYGHRPVIAAGSTGTVPATARLLMAICALPGGAVVLPGFDPTLAPGPFRGIAKTDPHRFSHPQHAMVALLGKLDVAPDEVTELTGSEKNPPVARTAMIRAALTLPSHSARWPEVRTHLGNANIEAATAGLALIKAPTPDLEARAIAVAAGAALEAGKSVGIISADRALSRRICAELDRFGIEVDDSAGIPLAQSEAGRLLREVVQTAIGDFRPAALVALLDKAGIQLGAGRGPMARLLEKLELGALRGRFAGAGLAGIRALVVANLEQKLDHAPINYTNRDAAGLLDLLDRIEAAFAPLVAALAAVPIQIGPLGLALSRTLDALCEPGPDKPNPFWQGRTELADFLGVLARDHPLAPKLDRHHVVEALVGLMAAETVYPARPGPTKINIWGPIEARLQTADLMVLCGLNEGLWPPIADPGPFLNRQMHLDAGLAPPDRRSGLAAHDFEMASGNRSVLYSCSARIGASPADPSRLLQRLAAIVGKHNYEAMARRGAVWLTKAIAMDHVAAPVPAARPAPCPLAALRPRSLSFTEIETLIRDPYAIYAKYVLGLRALDDLDREPGPADRGSLVHDILSQFVLSGGDPLSADAPARLEKITVTALAAFNDTPHRRDIWLARIATIGADWLKWEKDRRQPVVRRHGEIKGRVTLNVAGQEFTLRGRADRIDEMADGTLEIIDFKTGGVPDKTTMRQFLAPQLPLEAVTAALGGFEGIPAASISAMEYVKLSFGPVALDSTPFPLDGLSSTEVADGHWRRASALIEALLNTADQPFHSHLLPNPKQRYAGDFDQLARVREWATLGDGEGEAE
ncbi:MAG: double-strand break repair protein AddB, partial [Alphaproteobacteria bacterium]|nr:double-strand break repair protein AddB [Alphaproteobacteria bacterium]